MPHDSSHTGSEVMDVMNQWKGGKGSITQDKGRHIYDEENEQSEEILHQILRMETVMISQTMP